MKSLKWALASLMAMSLAQCFGQTASSSPQSPFVAPSFTVLGQRPDVGAIYYSWYGPNHWNDLLDFFPELGEYDSSDPSVIAQHFKWLKESGVDVVFADWCGTLSAYTQRIDANMPAILNAAQANGMKVIFLIDSYTGRTPQTVVSDVAYLNKTYGSYPAFWRSKRTTNHFSSATERPAMLVYLPPDNTTVATDWTKAIDTIHHSLGTVMIMHSNGYDFSFVTKGDFDGYFDYSESSEFRTRTNGELMPPGTWYIPTACPGFNALRSRGFTNITPRDNGASYDASWASILNLGINMPLVSITSFNLWSESTQIEPDAPGTDVDGYVFETYSPLSPTWYLDETAKWVSATHQYVAYDYGNAQTVYTQLGATNNSQGIWQEDTGTPGQSVATTAGGVPARTMAAGSTYMYFQVDKRFMGTGSVPLTVRVDYFDQGTGEFKINYTNAQKTTLSVPYVKLTNTNQWRTATFTIPNATFGSFYNLESDFRLYAASGTNLAVSLVAVTKTPTTP